MISPKIFRAAATGTFLMFWMAFLALSPQSAFSFVPAPSGLNLKTSTTTTTTTTTTALFVSSSPPPKQSQRPQQQQQNQDGDDDDEEDDPLQRTAAHLERLKQRHQSISSSSSSNGDDRIAPLLQEYLMQPANALKQELKVRNLPGKGRKPDLARRLVEYDLKRMGKTVDEFDQEEAEAIVQAWDPAKTAAAAAATTKRSKTNNNDASSSSLFCGLNLSTAASTALGNANFLATPSPIQKVAIPSLADRESLILHAETGSGKTLAYLLPLTEQLWLEYDQDINMDSNYGFILTPTRELAAQVAGVAMALAPPGSVRMVSKPTNLMNDGLRDQGEESENGGILDKGDGRTSPRLFVGSAKAIMHSLYGDGKMPASPTRKPKAMHLLKNTRWVVLDEVDRLLVGGGKKKISTSSNKHEKPAAVITSAVARRTLGRAQVIAASATVGRSLKRELSRVLGLEPKDCPRVVRAENDDEDSIQNVPAGTDTTGRHVGRAVKIPETVQHYVTAVDTSSVGKLLTNAFYVLKALNSSSSGAAKAKRSNNSNNKKILFVLTKTCGVNTQNTIGALKHFGCQPEPQSLLDALEVAAEGGGTNQMIELHRQVSGATGVGQSTSSYFSKEKDSEDEIEDEEEDDNSKGYVLVTGEDTVRGLHLDGLDVVVVVGRANGPDEYTHIAGRTGRAGRPGKVINVLSQKDAAALSGWEKMLDVNFKPIDTDGIAKL